MVATAGVEVFGAVSVVWADSAGVLAVSAVCAPQAASVSGRASRQARNFFIALLLFYSPVYIVTGV